MQWVHIVELVKALAWPLVVLVLVACFRSSLKSAFQRVSGAKLPGGTELSFGNAAVDKSPAKVSPDQTSEVGSSNIDLSKAANVYWLGSDITWTIDVLLRFAPSNTILHGLTQVTHHLKQLNLHETRDGQRLVSLLHQAKQLPEDSWDADLRNEYASELADLGNALGSRIASLQPNFVPYPD